MKYLLVLMFLVVGCATPTKPKQIEPKFKVGDCIMFGTLSVEDGVMRGSGIYMISFKIMGITKDVKNVYMNERFTSEWYYILKNLVDLEPKGTTSHDNLILPVKDVDGFNYADVFWEPKGYVKNSCNEYDSKVEQ